jgi:hypothetical protein
VASHFSAQQQAVELGGKQEDYEREMNHTAAASDMLSQPLPENNLLPPVGVEHPTNSPGNQEILTQRGTESGTPKDADPLEALAAQLAMLSPADRERLAALLLGKADNR